MTRILREEVLASLPTLFRQSLALSCRTCSLPRDFAGTIKGDGGKLTIPLHQRTAVAFLLTDRSMLLVSNVPALLSGTKVSAAMQSPSLRCDTAYEGWNCLCQCGATCPEWRTSVWRRLV